MEETNKTERIEKETKNTTLPQKSEEQKENEEKKENASCSQEETVEMVSIPLKSMEEQMKEIDSLKEQVATYSDGWKRERADFDNYRKRVLRNRDQEKQDLTVEVVGKYFELYDDLRLALKNAPTGPETKQWVEGIELILKKMQKILEAEGIEEINPVKGYFDPNLHEAISHEEDPNYQSGEIIEVVQPGYKIKNRVIRPAIVRVAK